MRKSIFGPKAKDDDSSPVATMPVMDDGFYGTETDGPLTSTSTPNVFLDKKGCLYFLGSNPGGYWKLNKLSQPKEQDD